MMKRTSTSILYFESRSDGTVAICNVVGKRTEKMSFSKEIARTLLKEFQHSIECAEVGVPWNSYNKIYNENARKWETEVKI